MVSLTSSTFPAAFPISDTVSIASMARSAFLARSTTSSALDTAFPMVPPVANGIASDTTSAARPTQTQGSSGYFHIIGSDSSEILKIKQGGLSSPTSFFLTVSSYARLNSTASSYESNNPFAFNFERNR